MSSYIAERHLLFSEKNGGSARRKLKVLVSAPSVVTQESEFPANGVIAMCHVEFEGLNEHSFDVCGMDSMQAVNLASNIESVIKRLSDKYDFFWATGGPYFEEG